MTDPTAEQDQNGRKRLALLCEEMGVTLPKAVTDLSSEEVDFVLDELRKKIDDEEARLTRPSYPSYCCQSCGECIGWVGRAFQWLRIPLHRCRK